MKTPVPAMVAILLVAAPLAFAAYFHESHRTDALMLSANELKDAFVVGESVAAVPLAPADAATIVGAERALGLFEGPSLRLPDGRCGANDPVERRCELAWESENLARSNGSVSRTGRALTLKPGKGRALVLRDWQKCAAGGECDGERFTYLGPLDPAPYHAIEIGYGHDSPSLVLQSRDSGQLVYVHYGSEATLVSPDLAWLASAEDLNGPTVLLITRLDAERPAIAVQCLGARSTSSSFGIAFKGWSSSRGLDLVLTRKTDEARATPIRLSLADDGKWSLQSPIDLAAEGFSCRQRGPVTPPRSS